VKTAFTLCRAAKALSGINSEIATSSPTKLFQGEILEKDFIFFRLRREMFAKVIRNPMFSGKDSSSV